MEMSQISRKVVVIGAGAVGTTYCYALMQTGLANEIVLIDLNTERVQGEVMDLSHGLPFVPPVNIRAGSYSDCKDANLIIVTAGAKQEPGESRLNLINRNAEIIISICKIIKKHSTEAVLVMVTNPVDVLTYIAIKQLQWPRERIIGSGTLLDSSRFRYMLSQHCRIDPRNVHAYILGEHGDSEVAVWSMAHIAGVSIKDYCPACRNCDPKKEHDLIVAKVRESAYHIIDYKGITCYAVGLSLVRISGAILRDEQSLLTVSTLLKGEYRINDICLSVPCVMGKTGVVNVVQANLSDSEQDALETSAKTLRNILSQIDV